MPVVVSCRGKKANDPSIYYCARAWAGWTGSPLGNPYHIGKDGDRTQVIAAYRKWLDAKVAANDPAVINALKQIKEDTKLGCWCAPLTCHCDEIINVWKLLQRVK